MNFKAIFLNKSVTDKVDFKNKIVEHGLSAASIDYKNEFQIENERKKKHKHKMLYHLKVVRNSLKSNGAYLKS